MTSVGVMASAVGVTGDVLLEPFNNLANWIASGTPAPTIVTGRTGTAVQIATSSSFVEYYMPAPATSDYITVGFAWRTDSVATQPQIIRLQSGAGVDHVTLRVTSAGALQPRRGSTTLGTSATGLIVANTWYYIEIQSQLDDTVGSVTVRRNGVAVLTLTNVDTRNGVTGPYASIRLTSAVAPTVTLTDDLYLNTGPAAVFQGDITIP